MAKKKGGVLGVKMNMTGGRWFILGVAVVAGGIVFMLHAVKERQTRVNEHSTVAEAPSASQAQSGGATGISPLQKKLLDQGNEQQAKQAQQTGASFVPTPTVGVKGNGFSLYGSNPAQLKPKKKAQDPAPQIQTVSYTPPPKPKKKGVPKGMIEVSRQDMDNVIGNISKVLKWQQQPGSGLVVSPALMVADRTQVAPATTAASPASGSTQSPGGEAAANGSAGKTSAPAPSGSGAGASVIPGFIPGNMIYAEFTTRSSSDIPSPVFGTILQGPQKGSRVEGSFTTVPSQNVLTIKFTKLIKPDGKIYSFTGYALGPRSLLAGVSTSVNRHVLDRVGAFLGASFLAGVQGYGQAIQQSGQTTIQASGTVSSTTVPFTAADLRGIAFGQAAKNLQPLSKLMQEQLVQPNTINLKANSPFLLLVTDVPTTSSP